MDDNPESASRTRKADVVALSFSIVGCAFSALGIILMTACLEDITSEDFRGFRCFARPWGVVVPSLLLGGPFLALIGLGVAICSHVRARKDGVARPERALCAAYVIAGVVLLLFVVSSVSGPWAAVLR